MRIIDAPPKLYRFTALVDFREKGFCKFRRIFRQGNDFIAGTGKYKCRISSKTYDVNRFDVNLPGLLSAALGCFCFANMAAVKIGRKMLVFP